MKPELENGQTRLGNLTNKIVSPGDMDAPARLLQEFIPGFLVQSHGLIARSVNCRQTLLSGATACQTQNPFPRET